MKKFICYLCGGFAAFNLMAIFPALMSGAPANWVGERIFCVLIFGGICFFLCRKKKENSDKPVMTIYGSRKEINSTQVNDIKPKENIEESKKSSLFSSPATENMAKELFKIASDSISEIINISGKLNEKGLCEAIIFNSCIILNDPILQKKPFYEATSNDYLILLWFLIQQQRKDLKEEKLMNFINERIEFYSSEYNKLRNEEQYSPIWVYSTFYLAPLEDEPKPCLDILQVMTFQVGLIRMSCKVHESLNKIY